MIIDAHTHIINQVHGGIGAGPTHSLPFGKVQVGSDRIDRLLPPHGSASCFAPEVLLEYMDWTGVDKAILLQGPYYGQANEYVWQATKQWPDRFIGAGYLDPRSSNARDTLCQITDQFGFRIIKFEVSTEAGLVGLYPDFEIDEDSMLLIWEEAERQGIVVTLDLGAVGSRAYQTGQLRKILEGYPGIKVVIAHLAQPPLTQSKDEYLNSLWQEQVSLGCHPNVWFDLSALPAFAADDEDYPYATVRQYIRQAVAMIGAEKVMWGSDVPGLLSYATYPQLMSLITRHCDFLSPEELAAVMGGNAWMVYGGASNSA